MTKKNKIIEVQNIKISIISQNENENCFYFKKSLFSGTNQKLIMLPVSDLKTSKPILLTHFNTQQRKSLIQKFCFT